MKTGERILIAFFILIIDLVIFFIPLTALVVVAVIISKPKWFKKFVDQLYKEE